jgi:hypothetical protein
VLSLETTGDKAYALVASCRLRWSDCRGPVRLYEAKVGGDDWRSVLTVDLGSAGPNGQIVVSGQSVYVMVHPHFGESAWSGELPVLYAVTPAGDTLRRLVPSPCGVRAVLAAAGPRHLSLWCQTGDGAGGSAPHVFSISRNGGKTWTRIWEHRSVYYGPIAITPEGTFLGASTAWLQIDRPDGSHETIRFSASGLYNEQIHRLNFVTARQGWVVTGPWKDGSTAPAMPAIPGNRPLSRPDTPSPPPSFRYVPGRFDKGRISALIARDAPPRRAGDRSGRQRGHDPHVPVDQAEPLTSRCRILGPA